MPQLTSQMKWQASLKVNLLSQTQEARIVVTTEVMTGMIVRTVARMKGVLGMISAIVNKTIGATAMTAHSLHLP
jgi:hypothetical protein